MSGPVPAGAVVGVVGAGAMGRGIAEVAALAGHQVVLVDAVPEVAGEAVAAIRAGLAARVARGKLSAATAEAGGGRLQAAGSVAALAGAALVIEAIVEEVAAKRALLAALEAVVAPSAVLASNTSSLRLSALGAAMARPERLAGLHFFNPAPVMKLVEVSAGPVLVDPLMALMRAWGKVPVAVADSPGYIVNRVARPFYLEALRALEAGVCDAATWDALMVDGGGFRMGPCALMDLVGHDVSSAVTASLFAALGEPEGLRPSALQLRLVAEGRLGRKTGCGLLAGGETVSELCPVAGEPAFTPDGRSGVVAGLWVERCGEVTAAKREAALGRGVVLYDLVRRPAGRVAVAASPAVPEAALLRVAGALGAAGYVASAVADRAGLAVMRTVRALHAEALKAVAEGVAGPDDIDLAMQLGLGWEAGPFAMARA